jgi:hypothetical protein
MKFLKDVEKSFMIIELFTKLTIVKTNMLSFVKTSDVNLAIKLSLKFE